MNATPQMTVEAARAELARYATRTHSIEGGGSHWPTLHVEILYDDQVIGSYDRNYGALYKSFCPFIGPDGRTYALYSRDYTATRIMALPSCEDMGGEDRDGAGFCPVEFYVPYDQERGLDGSIGFVAGCVWGDDSSWKVQFLDLLGVADGKLTRDERFGYLVLPQSLTLAEAVNVADWDIDNRSITIQAEQSFQIKLREGEQDRSVIIDDRPAEPDLVIPEPLIVGPFDSYHAQFFDDEHHWLKSQPFSDFASAYAIASRWTRERDREVRVWGRSAQASSLLAYLYPDGRVELRRG